MRERLGAASSTHRRPAWSAAASALLYAALRGPGEGRPSGLLGHQRSGSPAPCPGSTIEVVCCSEWRCLDRQPFPPGQAPTVVLLRWDSA